MATPISAALLLKEFRDHGVPYKTRAKWREHTRTSVERPWGPVHGVMIHHTGPYSSESGMLDLLWNGYPGLPGPLVQFGVPKSGVLHLCGWGRCNHAGGGDPVVLDRVIAEKTPYPAPRVGNDDPGHVDGNRHFYGFELINAGDDLDPFPAEQLDGAAAGAAVLCAHHGWTEKSVIGHKEWQKGKPDPAFDMNAFRRRVRGFLRAYGA